MDVTTSHVRLGVADRERSVAWYRRHLDYEVVGERPVDGMTVSRLAPPDRHRAGAVLELAPVDGAVTVGDAWGHIAVRVPDDELEARYDELIDAGVEDYRDPASCGGRYAFVRDPDGHEIEIVRRDHGSLWSLDHTMMRVTDATTALGFWVRAFAFEHTGRWEADTFANYFVAPAGAPREAMAVELTYNYDGRSYESGTGWGPLGLSVSDCAAAWDRLATREVTPVREPADAMAVVADPDGHDLELLED